jgi:phage-related protein
MRRTVVFYRMSNGRCPIEDFLDRLPSNVAQKVLWVIKLIKELDMVPSQYFKKLPGTEDIWECRVGLGSNIYRLFAFFEKGDLLILTHGIAKKTQKTPQQEFRKAEEYKADWLQRR